MFVPAASGGCESEDTFIDEIPASLPKPQANYVYPNALTEFWSVLLSQDQQLCVNTYGLGQFLSCFHSTSAAGYEISMEWAIGLRQ